MFFLLHARKVHDPILKERVHEVGSQELFLELSGRLIARPSHGLGRCGGPATACEVVRTKLPLGVALHCPNT